MEIKPKLRGFGLDIRQFRSKDGYTYIVSKTKSGSYHVFMEVEAKQAARRCGGAGSNTRQMWDALWKK